MGQNDKTNLISDIQMSSSLYVLHLTDRILYNYVPGIAYFQDSDQVNRRSDADWRIMFEHIIFRL